MISEGSCDTEALNDADQMQPLVSRRKTLTNPKHFRSGMYYWFYFK